MIARSAGGDGAGDDGLDGLTVPDDLSELTGGAGAVPTVEVVLTQIATAEALAAACALHKLDVIAVPSTVGAFAVVEPGSGAQVAAALSTTVAGVPLLLLSATGTKLAATRWQDGAKQADVPAALVLGGGAPDHLEGLLLGSLQVADLPGTMASADVSRWKALRLLAGQAKSGKGKKR